jgi:hypothetical protein
VKEHQKGTQIQISGEKSCSLKKTSHQISRILIIFGCIGYKFNDHVTIGNEVEICFGRLTIVATLQN